MEYANSTRFEYDETKFSLRVKTNSVEKKVIVTLHDYSDNVLLQYPIKESFIRNLFGSTLERRVHARVQICMKYAEKLAKEKIKYKKIVDNYKTLDILSEEE